MNRKHKTLKWGIALVSSMLTLNLSAQSSLIDYQSDKVDLGMGVEQSQMLTTASVEVVSGDELQKTAAISLKEALYGKLLGLTVLRPGGTVSDYSSGAVFNIRGQQTTTENGVLVLVDGIERSIEYLTVDEVGNNWSDVCADELATYGKVLEVPQQEEFYSSRIKTSDTKVFVIISDAMRYEVAAWSAMRNSLSG